MNINNVWYFLSLSFWDFFIFLDEKDVGAAGSSLEQLNWLTTIFTMMMKK